MGFLDINLGDAQEPKAAKEGEYIVRIVDINEGIDKNGHNYLQPILDIPGEPTAKSFSHFLGLPYEGMDEKSRNNSKWRLKLFFEAFGIDHSKTIDTAAIKGRQAWAILGVDSNDQYGEQNFVKKFVRPA
jgi:hypothetical protein